MQEMQEMWVQSLGQEDLLEKAMETHSSTLAWKIPWTEESGKKKKKEEPGRLQSTGSQRVQTPPWNRGSVKEWSVSGCLVFCVFL